MKLRGENRSNTLIDLPIEYQERFKKELVKAARRELKIAKAVSAEVEYDSGIPGLPIIQTKPESIVVETKELLDPEEYNDMIIGGGVVEKHLIIDISMANGDRVNIRGSINTSRDMIDTEDPIEFDTRYYYMTVNGKSPNRDKKSFSTPDETLSYYYGRCKKKELKSLMK